MRLKIIEGEFAVAKLADGVLPDLTKEFMFFAKTDEENSLVCLTKDVPDNAIQREDGWRAFRIQGVLDFSMVGVLAGLSALLAENQIGIFAISTYNTDYILTKADDYSRAMEVLSNAGYQIV